MLVITFLIFSFGADFCYDYSVWKFPNGSNKNECYKPGPNGESWYTDLRNCKLHPSTVTKEECKQRGDDFFYCQHSHTCIHSKFTCDGVFNCIEGKIVLIDYYNESNSFKIFTGEDEDYKMCKKLQSVKYSPEATIKCQENKR